MSVPYPAFERKSPQLEVLEFDAMLRRDTIIPTRPQLAWVLSSYLHEAHGYRTDGHGAAMLIQQAQYWLAARNRDGEHFGKVEDGRRWIRNSQEAWRKQLAFRDKAFRRIWRDARDSGVLLVRQDGTDRTPWVSIDTARLRELEMQYLPSETASQPSTDHHAPHMDEDTESRIDAGSSKNTAPEPSTDAHASNSGACTRPSEARVIALDYSSEDYKSLSHPDAPPADAADPEREDGASAEEKCKMPEHEEAPTGAAYQGEEAQLEECTAHVEREAAAGRITIKTNARAYARKMIENGDWPLQDLEQRIDRDPDFAERERAYLEGLERSAEWTRMHAQRHVDALESPTAKETVPASTPTEAEDVWPLPGD